jgi:hypothetical protein
MENFLIALGVLIALLGIFNLGLVIAPRPFRPHPAPSQPGEPFDLPADLPEPVRRHLERVIAPPRDAPAAGQVRSAVIWGRGKSCVRGVWLPLRYKLWLKPGEAALRRSEMTFFQRPVMRSVEGLTGGRGVQELGGRPERSPRVDHGQTLALWAASIWSPSFMAYPSPGHWEAVDDTTARLVFPFGEELASLLFHFDFSSGQLTHISGRRYSSEEGSTKEFWRMDMLEWKVFQGLLLPCHVGIAWGEMGSPWAYWTVDGVALNVHVSDQLG